MNQHVIKSRKTAVYGLLLVLAFGLTAMNVSAQQVYTLDKCIEMALQNNIRTKNAENDLNAAKLQKKSAFTHYFPSVSATGGGFISDKGLLEMNTEAGKLSLVDDGLVGGVTATLPLFTGGQIVNANKLADVNVDVSRLRRRQSENEVRLTVEQYFWQVVTLKEKLHTIGTLQAQLDRIHRDVEAAVAAGVTNRNDQLQVELRRNEMRSKRISIANTLDVSLHLLAQYIGCPTDSAGRIDVDWKMDGGLPLCPDELYRSPESSLPLTAEYHLLHKQVDASRLQHKITVGKNLPTVAVGGGYVYENLMDRDHSFWIGGVTVSVPLTKWWGGSHDMKRQKLQVRNAENQLKDQSELLVIRMRNAWNAMNDAYQQVKIAIESIGQAEENLRLQSDYYQAGTCTMSDLLEAQALYQQSRDKYVKSYSQYEVKKREYLLATGR